MKPNLPKRIVLICTAMVLSTFACNFTTLQGMETQSPAAEINSTPTQTPQPESAESQNLCYNLFYPVISGATWTYTSTGSMAGNYNFTDTITDIREDGFTLTSQFDELTRTQEWACLPEGLASLTFGGGAAAGISTSDVQLDLNTSNIQGVNLPKNINDGDQWPYSLDFNGKMEITGSVAEVQGTANYTFNAIGEENVSTPAGSFDAMKIRVEMVLRMQIAFAGANTPAEFTSTTDIWFAQNVGWVKAVSTGEMLGTAINETIELQSYSIP